MTELILGIALFAIAMVGLAAGSLLGGRCLRRGCASSIGPDGRPQTCSTCGKGGPPEGGGSMRQLPTDPGEPQ